ncbi:hypothetical protein ACFO5X_21095 [Seohaeicola nanhaiensis]|uniref:Methyltransferase FkbM domain-containing protein n=1 Tax=Seohaeicola nanhaiensis TaxID=1387282 RepID=A0ABV9KLY5_9RHOB
MSFPAGPDGMPAHLLHIGAGDGDGVTAWQAAGVTRFTLVEADPDTARALSARLRGTPGVQVITGAVSADLTPRPFRRCNLPGLNSFRAPEGLEALFPGLRVLDDSPVTPLDPVALVRELELGDSAALLIEAPGEALGILQALQAAGLLDRFATIRLQEGRETLYAGAPPAEAIRNWLEDNDFMALLETDSDDPDRPHLSAARTAALVRLRAERDAALSAMEVLRAELDEIRTVAGERAERLAGLERDRDTARAEAAAATQRLTLARAELERAEEQVGLIRELLTAGEAG